MNKPNEQSSKGKSFMEIFDQKIFGALSVRTRILIFNALCEDGEQCVNQVAARVPVHQSLISRNLKQLFEAGLLKRRRQGQEVFYVVNAKALSAQLREMADVVAKIAE